MATSKLTQAEMKKLANTLEEGEIYLLDGKKQVYLAEVSVNRSGISAEVLPVTKNGKINASKAQDIKVTSPATLTLVQARQQTFVTISAKALKKAEKAFQVHSNGSSKSTSSKIYAVLRKEKRVAVAKVLKDLKTGKKCSFRSAGETITRKIPNELIFTNKKKATAALKNLKKPTKVSRKSNTKSENKKGYLLLKKSGTILDCRILENMGSKKYKVEISVNGKTYKKSVPNIVVFTSKSAAKKAARA